LRRHGRPRVAAARRARHYDAQMPDFVALQESISAGGVRGREDQAAVIRA